MNDEETNTLRRITEETIRSPWFHRMLKDVILQVIVASRRIEQIGVVESFVENCWDQGFKFRIGGGKLLCTDYTNMPYRMKEFHEANYHEIKRYIEQVHYVDHSFDEEVPYEERTTKPDRTAQPNTTGTATSEVNRASAQQSNGPNQHGRGTPAQKIPPPTDARRDSGQNRPPIQAAPGRTPSTGDGLAKH